LFEKFHFQHRIFVKVLFFQKQNNMEKNLTKRVLIFLIDSAIPLIAFQISCTVKKKKITPQNIYYSVNYQAQHNSQVITEM